MRIRATAAVAVGAALALTMAPAFAASRVHPAYSARAQASGFDARAQAVGEAVSSRLDAIHECNQQASKFANYAWGNNDSDHYRACMAQRGHQE